MVIKVRSVDTREIIGTFSDYISLIWTERFNSYGDFELSVPLTKKHFDLLIPDRFIEIPTSSDLMIIENVNIQDDDNQRMTIKGKSFESLLGRRIVYNWRDTQSDVKLSDLLSLLTYDNLLSKDVEGRDIPWLSIDISIPDDLKDQTLQTSINRGDDLGSSIYALGGIYGFCPRASFDPSTRNVILNFIFGSKTDIIFKHANYNLSKSSYALSTNNFKTSAIVAGSGEEEKRTIAVISRSTTETIFDEDGTKEVTVFDYKGVTRREMFVDARDIQKKSGETNSKYIERLKERGIDKLKENNKEYVIDGTITNTGRYVLNVDYSLGDIVKIESNFYSATARITEIIQSWSDTGYEIYPSFETIEVTNGEISESYN